MDPALSAADATGAPASGVRVLVVDDEPVVADIITYALERCGHQVSRAGTGPEALVSIADSEPDLVVLDLMLPGMGGMEVLRQLRQTTRVPVILVSAIADVAERVVGLELGADDYVTKPFSPRELTARVGSVLRRAGSPPPGDVVVFGDLRIDGTAREVQVGGCDVHLTTKEFDLLAFLAAAPRRVFTREELLRSVWSSTSEWQDPATVTEHIRRIRIKLAVGSARSARIATVRGAGYRFEG